ncbi:MAG: hypothetical protein JWL70_3015 [Acidimicrobiia bacterium]|nr:hypothetical protein [Acidimicrobiia bacterium]
MAEGLQHASPDQVWQRFKKMMGEDGLITYRYLGRRTAAYQDVEFESMTLRSDMRNAAGGVMAAPLAIGMAEAGGHTDREVLPAPVTFSLRILDDAKGVTRLIMHPRPIHIGRTLGFSESYAVDADNPERVIAVIWGSGVSLGELPEGFEAMPAEREIEDSPDLPPLHEVFGAVRRAPGVWGLPELQPFITGTSGTLHLGPMHVVFEAAATDLVADCVGSDAIQAEDWNVMFVRPGRIGPFAVTGDVIEGGLGRIMTRLTLIDEGNEGRTVASCFATFRRTE